MSSQRPSRVRAATWSIGVAAATAMFGAAMWNWDRLAGSPAAITPARVLTSSSGAPSTSTPVPLHEVRAGAAASLASAGASSRTRSAGEDAIQWQATLARVQPGDRLHVTIHSFTACADRVAARATRDDEMVERAADSHAVAREIPVASAARYDVTFELIVHAGEFEATRETRRFVSIRKESCR